MASKKLSEKDITIKPHKYIGFDIVHPGGVSWRRTEEQAEQFKAEMLEGTAND